MPINSQIAQGMQPFNAANTMALATDIGGAQTQNALQQLLLQREQDPGSSINRARDIGVQTDEAELNVVREQLEQVQRQNAIPQIRSVLGAIGQVKKTIDERGVAAGRQRLSERVSFLQSQEVLPEDFEIGVDLDSMSDEEFVRGLEEEEQDLITTLSSIQPENLRTSAAIGDMQALGIPMTPEGFQQYNELQGGSVEDLERLVAEARLRGTLIEQDIALEERGREAEERVKQQKRKASGIKNGIDQARKLANITRELEGKFTQPGFAAGARRDAADFTAWLGGLTGFDTEGLEEQVSNFDQARKGMEQQVANLLEQGNLGEATNAKLRQAQQRMANPNISPGAILEIQAQIAESLLEEAVIEDIEIPNRGAIETSINRMRGLAEAAEPVVDVPDVLSSAKQTLGDLSRNVASGSQSLAMESLQRADQQLESLRGSIPDQDIERAKALIQQGTEESILAARGLLDRASETAQRGVAQAREIAQMGLQQLQQLDLEQLSDEALAAAERRWEELNAE